MNNLESKLPDADMQAAPKALLRAARLARRVASQTGTAIIVMRNGEVVEEPAIEGQEGDE